MRKEFGIGREEPDSPVTVDDSVAVAVGVA